MLSALVSEMHAAEEAVARVRFPSNRYASDPVGFCEDVLGYAPTGRQIEVLEAVRDHDRTALPSGRKTGKTRVLASLALWWFSLYEDATVVFTAPCERQITEVGWYDLVGLYHGSGRCLSCVMRDPEASARPCPHSTPVDGELSASVRTGLRQGQRRVIGLAPRNADNARGISGPHQLWLVDEASGVSRAIYEAADGNRAAGAKLVVAGQPTSRATWFFDACENLGFHVIRLSSTETPNVTMGRKIVPGLADTPWIDEKRQDWSREDDPRFRCEVLGLFPSNEETRIVSDQELSDAFARHEGLNLEKVDGQLWIGIDPAGGRGGDKSAIVVRRAHVVTATLVFNGATDAILAELDILLRKHRRYAAEPVRVNFDSSARWGADLASGLRLRKEMGDDSLHYTPLDMKGNPKTDPALREARCARLVDAMYWNLSLRLRSDAAVPFDPILREELLFAEMQPDLEDSRFKLISKRAYRKQLGRSPDLSDAYAFAFWEGRVAPASRAALEAREFFRKEEPDEPHGAERSGVYGQHGDVGGRGAAMDPYAAQDAFDPRRGGGAPGDDDD